MGNNVTESYWEINGDINEAMKIIAQLVTFDQVCKFCSIVDAEIQERSYWSQGQNCDIRNEFLNRVLSEGRDVLAN